MVYICLDCSYLFLLYCVVPFFHIRIAAIQYDPPSLLLPSAISKVYPFVLINWLLLKHCFSPNSRSPHFYLFASPVCVFLIRLPRDSKYGKCLLFKLFSVCPYVCLSVCLSDCLYVCMFLNLFVFMSLLIISLAPRLSPLSQPHFHSPSADVRVCMRESIQITVCLPVLVPKFRSCIQFTYKILTLLHKHIDCSAFIITIIATTNKYKYNILI